MRPKNRVAIVTGVGKGPGHAIAVRLAREGAHVALVSRTEKNTEKTAGEIDAARAGAAKAYAFDVSNHADAQRIGEQILSNFDWDVVLNANLKGAFNFVQGVQRSMIEQPWSYY
jgi:3-oxoacyl-[acyl-carrier protein] reductase